MKIQTASLSEDAVPADKLLFEMISDIQSEISRLRLLMPRDIVGRHNISKEREIDGVTRIASELVKYINEKPNTDLASLIDDISFSSEMENRCFAPRYFAGPSEFREALNRAIKELRS